MSEMDSPDRIDLNKLINRDAKGDSVDPGSEEGTIRKWLRLGDAALASDPQQQDEYSEPLQKKAAG